VILVKGYDVVDVGDPSAGILEARWVMDEAFWFDNKFDQIKFEQALSVAFQYATENPVVIAGDITVEL